MPANRHEADKANEGQRLNKVLAHAGVASRRACDALIEAGRVCVNSVVVRTLGTRVDPAHDRIEVDGRAVSALDELAYYVVYKPVGHVSTVSDPQGRPTVLDLLPPKVRRATARVYPVGRLDLDSEGLVLLTNDGALTQRLLHPRYGHVKEYLVLIRGNVTERDVARLGAGVDIADQRLAVGRMRIAPRAWAWRGQAATPQQRWVSIELTEGRKRQVRRMIHALSFGVARLVRVRLGPLDLGDLRPGQSRSLSDAERRALRRSVGLDEESVCTTARQDETSEGYFDRN